MHIPEHFPYGLSEPELSKEIKGFAALMVAEKGDSRVTHKYPPLIQLGLAERDARRNRKTARLTLGIAALSLFVSAVALYVAWSGNRSNAILDEIEIETMNRVADALERLPTPSE